MAIQKLAFVASCKFAAVSGTVCMASGLRGSVATSTLAVEGGHGQRGGVMWCIGRGTSVVLGREGIDLAVVIHTRYYLHFSTFHPVLGYPWICGSYTQ